MRKYRKLRKKMTKLHGVRVGILKPSLWVAFYLKGLTDCVGCGMELIKEITDGVIERDIKAEIHHEAYHRDITLNDLSIVCRSCHKKLTYSNISLQENIL